jgi:hypothetical protein
MALANFVVHPHFLSQFQISIGEDLNWFNPSNVLAFLGSDVHLLPTTEVREKQGLVIFL